MRRGTLLTPSLPHKRRVLRLQPLPAVSTPISAACALRQRSPPDPARKPWRTRAPPRLQGFTEQNAIDAVDEPRKLVSPPLERTLWARRESGLAGGLDSCPLSLRRLKPDPAMTGDGRGQAIPYSGLKRRSAYCNRGHAIGRAWIHA